MALNVTTASNISNTVGKWVPYYYKSFMLGRTDDASQSSDGEIYITEIAGTSGQSFQGFCNSSANCNFYYTLKFLDTGAPGNSAYFYVTKYNITGDIVDTIYASETGTADDGKWWLGGQLQYITIDVGVNVLFPTGFNVNDNDIYKIALPSVDAMERRKIYHGGYSSFLRMPATEGDAHHSDIIPANLNGKNLTVLFNPNHGFTISSYDGLFLASSKEDTIGNTSVSLFLEWNVNQDGATSNNAGSTVYEWGAGETWQLGSVFANDISPTSNEDSPLISNFPASDVLAVATLTGTTQVLNITTSGRAGKARMRTENSEGPGSSKMMAHNQFWQVILIIS